MSFRANQKKHATRVSLVRVRVRILISKLINVNKHVLFTLLTFAFAQIKSTHPDISYLYSSLYRMSTPLI